MNLDGRSARPKLTAPRSEIEPKLERQIARAHGFRALRPTSSDELTEYLYKIQGWGKYNIELLRSSFSSGEVADEYLAAHRRPDQKPNSIEERVALVHDVLRARTRFLTQLKAELQLYERLPLPSGSPRRSRTQNNTIRQFSSFMAMTVLLSRKSCSS